jgi:amino acid adenylation domain-containing protein
MKLTDNTLNQNKKSAHVIALLKKGIRFAPEHFTSENQGSGELKVLLGDHTLTDDELSFLRDNKPYLLSMMNRCKISALSPSQERLWYLDQLGYGFQYHIPTIYQIKGAINIEKLKSALQSVIDRHEALRTNFKTLDGYPLQYIHTEQTLDFTLYRLPQEKQNIAEVVPRDLLQGFYNAPFNLSESHLFRVLLIQSAPDEYCLAMSIHHIVSDGWSMQVLLNELTQVYSDKPLAPLKLQYSGYSAWLQKLKSTDESLEFWKNKLKHYSDLMLPTDFIRPAKASGQGGVSQAEISDVLWRQIDTVSKAFRTTPLAVFSAAVFLLLCRYSQESDFCFGMPVANRSNSELEPLIGFFVNTLILKPDLDIENCSQNELIDIFRQTLLEALTHQSTTIETVLEAVQPKRNTSTSPIFQVLINYARITETNFLLDDATLRPSFYYDISSAKFDLSFTLNEVVAGEKYIFIEYASDLFKVSTIERMNNQLLCLLSDLVREGDRPVNELLLSDTKIDQSKSDPAVYLPYMHGNETNTLHGLFEQASQQYSQNIALIAGDQTLTYAQLDQRSDQVALYLLEQGPKSDSVIAIACEPSFDLIIAILAVLKSGAAYLTLDVNYPANRIQHMLTDCSIDTLLTHSSCMDVLSDIDYHAQYINLTTLQDKLAHYQGKANYSHTGNSLAYVNYTSGSTGMPKGVQIEHSSVINHNLAVIQAYQLSPQDRVLQFSSVSFDIFVEEVFPTLLCGAALVLPDQKLCRDPEYLDTLAQQSQLSVMNFPTAYWHTVVDKIWQASNLRLVVIGGEKASSDHWLRWHTSNPDIEVINTYGPTETTVIASYFKLTSEFNCQSEIPIGKPIAGVTINLLDQNMHPVPIGIPGDIYIGGAGVSRGYIGHDELNQQVFINDPSAKNNQDTYNRLYKTGDIGRWLEDGNIAFIGRKDQQLKIRGYRIEPGEIEHILRSHSQIDDAVVIAISRSETNETEVDKKLLVWISVKKPAADNQGTYGDIEKYIKAQLPDYMRPQLLPLRTSMPTLPSGKIDRKQLQQEALEHTLTVPHKNLASDTVPLSEKQIKLVKIWQELLGCPINPLDNFYEKGGHSLLSVQLVSRLNSELALQSELRLQVADIIQYPTIDGIIELIEQKQSSLATTNTYLSETSLYITPLKTATMNIIIPGMPGMSEGYHELAQAIDNDGEVFGISMQGFESEAPLNSIEQMAQHNIEQIQAYRKKGSINFYAHSFGGTVTLEMLHQMKNLPYEIKGVTFIDTSFHQQQSAINYESIVMFFQSLLSQNPESYKAQEKIKGLEQAVKGALYHADYESWPDVIMQLMDKFGFPLDRVQFKRMWHVIERALTASYTPPTHQLAHSLRLVVAQSSQGWLETNTWNQYFKSVQCEYTPGTHDSIIKSPHCQQWLISE